MIWYCHLIWVIGAGVLGCAVSAVFAGWLHLRRTIFLIPYVLLASAFIAGYARWSQLDIGNLIGHNWPWGVVGAIVLGVFMVKNILSQPASARSTGAQLGLDLLWQGVVYGGVDALLLSVMPVLATWQAFSQLGWATAWLGKLIVGGIAIIASLWVTFAYHWGFPEYRGQQVASPLFGNGVMSLGYLITTNPIAALGSHIAMHVAGVLHGPESKQQLPPHYRK
jgi:MFS family permease